MTTSTTNTDTATFSGTLDSNPTITIDQAGQNIGSIILTGSANGADTIGTTGGNALLLSSGGSITMSGADSTINAPLILEPANATSNGTYTFTGGSFGGAISGGSTTGTITLNLVGETAEEVYLGGNVSNGGASSLALVVSGPAYLDGTNSYTGATTVNAGTLELTGSLSSATALVLGGGTFIDYSSTSSQTVNGLTLNSGFSEVNTKLDGSTALTLGAITRNAGGMVDFNYGTTQSNLGGAIYSTVSNTDGIIGPWAVYSSGSSLAYAVGGGANSSISGYTGGTTATSGTLADMTSASTNYTYAGSGATATLTQNVTGNTLQVTGTGLTIANAGKSITLNGLMDSGTGTLTLGGTGNVIIGANNELDVVAGDNEIKISSIITGSGSVVSGSGGDAGWGVLGLYGNNTYSGGTVVTGGTLDIGAAGTSSTNSAIGTGTLTIDNGAILTNDSGSAVTLATNNLQIWNGSFSFNGTSALSFGAGDITINASSVTISDLESSLSEAGNMGGTGNLILSGDISLSGAVNYAGTLTNYNAYSGTATISGAIGSNVTGVIENGGTLILTGANTYAGGTTIDTGTIQVGNGGTSGNLGSGGVLDNGDLIYDRTDSLTESNVISGSGLIQQMGSGTTTFAAANTYTGGTVLDGGTIQLSGAGTLGSIDSTLTFYNGTLDLNGTNQGVGILTGYGTILNSNTGTTSTFTEGNGQGSGGNNLFSGTIKDNSGSGGKIAFVVTGTGSLTLTGTNTYSGGTTINTGATLLLGEGTGTGTLGTGGVVDNGILDYYEGASVTDGNNISGSGSVAIFSSTTVTLTGSNSYTGGTSLGEGSTLILGSSGALGTTGTIYMDGTLEFTAANTTDYSSRFSTEADQNYKIDTNGQSVTFASNLASSGAGLYKSGTGTLTLTASNSYTGTTMVTGGTLILTQSNSYSGGTTVYNSTLQVSNASGSATGTGEVQILGTSVLGGTGIIAPTGVTSGIAVNIGSGATISPSQVSGVGFSHLTLAVSGTSTVNLASGSEYVFNLASGTSTSDEVLITGGSGSLTLNDQEFSDFTFNLESGFTTGTYILFDTNSSSGINGSLASGSLRSGTLNGNTATLVLSTDSSGHADVALIVATVPEPSTWALFALGLGALAWARRRSAAA